MKKLHHRFTTTNIGAIVIIIAFGLCFTGLVRANTVSLIASGDTYITEHANLGGPASIHGSDDSLKLIRGTGVFRTFPLVKFDLTAYANRIVSSPTAEFRLELTNAWDGLSNIMQSVSIREVLVDWDENTTSFSNFGGTGFNEFTQTGPNLVTRNVTYTSSEESILFTIPSSLVQGWIDDPTTNYGFIVISNTTANQKDLIFSSREGVNAPGLSFDVAPVPVPSALVLFGSGLWGIFGAKKYKVNSSRYQANNSN